jgi:hypothetical protein
MTSIYVPGSGYVDICVYRVNKAVNEYNNRLSFKRNLDTGDWCVYMQMPSPEADIPLIGFGDTIPEPDRVVKKLWESDSMVHGDKLYNDILKSQEDFKKAKRYAADQASMDSAERVEKLMRKHGKSPVVKVFMGSKGGDTSDS